VIKHKKLLYLLISFLLFTPAIQADSLWDNAKAPFYGVQNRRIKTGDIITIYISEATSAVQQASTQTERDAGLQGRLDTSWQQIANLLGNETENKKRNTTIRAENNYEGSGQTSRRSQVKAVISSIVTEILDSGNIYIEGIHQVKVNNELETIRIAGIIRPQDISPKNSVFSYQIAKAEISVNGSGVVADNQSPGIMTKLFNWLF
jgi:flagellar L-ring protein precursor FlgH